MLAKKFSKGLVFTLTASFLGAVWIVITRYLLVQGEDPINVATWIVSLTVPVWLILLGKQRKAVRALTPRMIALLVVIGIASSIGINYLQALALANSPAVNFSFLYRTVIIFTIFFAWLFFKEKITQKKLLLVIIIFIGSYLLTTEGKGFHFTKGDIYTLLVAISGALVGNILIKHTVSKMHTDVSAACTTFVAACSLTTLALLTHSLHFPTQPWIILLGSCFYFLHIFFRNRSYKHASASFVTLVFALAPFFVSILSFFVLGETLSLIQLCGGILIVGSVFFVHQLKI